MNRIYVVDEPCKGDTLQSPGWNKGKARNETLGTHR